MPARPADPFEEDDGSLMESISKDDECALETLIGRYWLPLLRFAAGMTGSSDAAEDIVQEVFVRVWEARKRWVSGGTVRGYLYTTARNLCLHERDRMRVRHKWGQAKERQPTRNPTPLDMLQQRELLTAIKQAIDNLPERRREVFTLACLHGLSHQEVAAVMGIATPTVANQMTAALEAMREAVRRVSDERI